MVSVNILLAQSASSDQNSVSNIVLGQKIQFHSVTMNENLTALVYVPANSSVSKRRYPVIYTLDGEANFLQTVSTVSFLAANGLMPEAIVIGVGSTDRIRDLTPKLTKTNSPPAGIKEYGGADKFLTYLDKELIPYIDKNYPTQPFRVLIGHSIGGLFATHTMITQPKMFRGFITLEPSLWWDDRASIEKVKSFFSQNPNFNGRLMMVEGGSVEGWRNDWETVKKTAPAKLRSDLIIVPNESHETLPFLGQYQALQKIFGDYIPQFRTTDSLATLTALEEQYSALSKEYGYTVEIPDFALLEVAQRNMSRKDFRSAVKTLEKAVAIYPNSSRFPVLLAEAQRGASTALPQTTKKVERISAKDGANFIGTWEGTLKTEPGMPVQIAVVIEDKEGFLSGYMLARGMRRDGGDLRFDISEIRIKGKSFEWDRLERNGGTHVHLAELSNANTLKGLVELRDHPPFPEGFTPPKVTFDLKRTTK